MKKFLICFMFCFCSLMPMYGLHEEQQDAVDTIPDLAQTLILMFYADQIKKRTREIKSVRKCPVGCVLAVVARDGTVRRMDESDI